jgi:hypothetical protein
MYFSYSAEKRGSECFAGNMAHIQAHKVSEARQSRSSANTSKEVSSRHLRVSALFEFLSIVCGILSLVYSHKFRLRKVKMDQRKLMDNANTITDMAKTQNTVYEIVSDMATRQDALEERIAGLEDKIQTIRVGQDTTFPNIDSTNESSLRTGSTRGPARSVDAMPLAAPGTRRPTEKFPSSRHGGHSQHDDIDGRSASGPSINNRFAFISTF